MLKRFGRRRLAPLLLAIALHAVFAAALVTRAREVFVEQPAIQVTLVPLSRPQPAQDLSLRAQDGRAPAEAPAPTARRAQDRKDGPASPSAEWQVRAPDPDDREDLRRSLRAGVGCSHAELLALSKAERQACNDKLAAGAKDTAPLAVVSPRLQKEFDGVFECPAGDVWCEYRIGKAPYPGLFSGRKKKPSEWD